MQAGPRKLASIVKRKTFFALGIAVDFLGDHLKDKKAIKFNTLDKLLSEDFGVLILFHPECTLKIWNAIKLACFLKASLNPVLADIISCLLPYLAIPPYGSFAFTMT